MLEYIVMGKHNPPNSVTSKILVSSFFPLHKHLLEVVHSLTDSVLSFIKNSALYHIYTSSTNRFSMLCLYACEYIHM